MIAAFGGVAANIATASRKGVSYTVADWSGDAPIINADGIYRVRVIG